METNRRTIAFTELVLIFPSVLFLAAVVVRQLPPLQDVAQSIVTWYSLRLWTLWILLVTLPLIALFVGGMTLLRSRPVAAGGSLTGQPAAVSRQAGLLLRTITAETFAAALILAIVVLHILAN